MGFAWKKNTTNELMGSTAEHCADGGTQVRYNNGAQVGTRYYYGKTADSIAPAHQFDGFDYGPPRMVTPRTLCTSSSPSSPNTCGWLVTSQTPR